MNEKKEIKISLTTFIVGIIAIVLLVLVIVMGMYIATQSKEPHKQESQVIEKNENENENKIIIASKQNDEKVNDVQEIELENSNLNPWFLGKSSETSLREIEDRISKDFSIIYKRRKSVCSV